MVTEIEMAPEFFIGREEELGLVGDLLTAPWGSRQVLLVRGPGGVGKTRLLREIHRRRDEYAQRLEKPLLFTRVIDFDDVSVRLPWSFGQRLVAELGREQFREYLDAQEVYVQYQLLGASSDLLREQDQRGRREFIRGYNRVAEQKRICLILDTTEKVQDTELWRYLREAIEGMKNTVLVMAGRELDEIKSDLKRLLGQEAVHFRHLSPFDESEALDYFLHTDAGVEIEPEMREKLYLLSGGHPIFIALAVEWLRRDMPIDHITTRPLAELKALDEERLAQARKEFETILVNKILDLTPIDQAVLRMAHVYLRFDDKILQYLLDLSDEETVSLSHELHNFPFIRPRPPNIYTLHDEMRRLVNEHTWPNIDPRGTQRRSISVKMVSYYDGQLKTLNESLDRVHSIWEEARKDEDTEKAAQVFPQLNRLEQQRTLLEVERFYYLPDADLGRAYDYFLEAFDEATWRYRYGFRELIWTEMQPHASKYADEQRYQIGIREVKFLLDGTRYDDSYQRAKALLGEYGGQDPVWRIDTLIQMANAAARKGETEKALGHFQKALQVCEQNQLADWIGRVESGLGWVYRLMSKWGEAERIYERALEHSSEAGDLERLAQVLNNLGYVRHLRGDPSSGLNLCKQALEIWEQLQRPRWVAITHSTIGNIWSKLGKHSEAMVSYEAALRIFRDQEDWEWIATVYHQIAFAQWWQGEHLEEAQQYAEESIRYCRQYGIERELFTALHRLGHIHMSRGELQKAQVCFEESYQISRKMQDDYRLRDNLLGLAEIAYQKRDYEEAEKYVRQALEGIEPEEWVSPYLLGGMYQLLGNVFFARGEHDKALAEYCKAYPKIAQEESFSPYTPYRLSKALESLEERIGSLPAEPAEQWCDDLKRCWEKQIQGDSERIGLLSFCLVQKVRARGRKESQANV